MRETRPPGSRWTGPALDGQSLAGYAKAGKLCVCVTVRAPGGGSWHGRRWRARWVWRLDGLAADRAGGWTVWVQELTVRLLRYCRK